MRRRFLTSSFLLVSLCLVATTARRSQSSSTRHDQNSYQPNSLCGKDERIIFSCTVKRAAKIVSLCASKDLTKDRGYLQYRFGLPNKIELEFPKSRTRTQEQFRYSHYFRFQVDLTEINFNIDGFEYQIFDTYNGEEKPKISEEGVSVTAPGKPKDVTITCRSKAKTNYSKLSDVFPHDPE